MNNTACPGTAATQEAQTVAIPTMRFLDDGFRSKLLALDAAKGCPLAARLLSGLTGVKNIRIRHFFHPHVFITDGGFVHNMQAQYIDTEDRRYIIETVHGEDRDFLSGRSMADIAAMYS